MRNDHGTRDCCTPWSWLVRLIFAFLLAASLIPPALAQTELVPPDEGVARGMLPPNPPAP